MSELDTAEAAKVDAPAPPPQPDRPEPVGEPREAPEAERTESTTDSAPDDTADPEEPEEAEASAEAADVDDAADSAVDDGVEPDEPEEAEASAEPEASAEVATEGDKAADVDADDAGADDDAEPEASVEAAADAAVDEDAQPDEPEGPDAPAEPEASAAADGDDVGDAEPDEAGEPEAPEGQEPPERQEASGESAAQEEPDGSVEQDTDAVEEHGESEETREEGEEPLGSTEEDSPESAESAESGESAEPEHPEAPAEGEEPEAPEGSSDPEEPEDPDDELPELELELKPHGDSVPYSVPYTASLGAEQPDAASKKAPELPHEEGQAEASDEPEQTNVPDSELEDLDDRGETAERSAVREFSSNDEGAEYGRTEWGEAQSLLTDEQRDAFNGYSGEKSPGEEGAPDYKEINGYLRGYAPGSAEVDSSIQRMDEGMRLQTVPEDLTVMRETGLNSFNCPIEKIKGSVQTDQGYLSTALGSDPDFDASKEVVLHLTVPEGTPAMYMEGLSQYDSERELLLDRGLSYLVTEATYGEDEDRYHVYGEIIR